MKMKNLISMILLLLTVALDAWAGGVYTRVDRTEDFTQGDILIIASHCTINGEEKLVLMSTDNGEGAFSAVVYGDYGDYDNQFEMPESLSVASLNADGLPYEYCLATLSEPNKSGMRNCTIKERQGDRFIIDNSSAWTIYDTNIGGVTEKEKFFIPFFRIGVNPLKCSWNVANIESCRFYVGGASGSYTYFYKKTDDLPENVDFTIGSVGYATLYYGEKDVTVPEGMTAYTYGLSENKLSVTHTFSKDDVIPAGTAVVVKGNPGTYTLTLNTPSAAPFGGNNILRGSDTEEMTEGDGKFYVLSVGSNGLGFYYGAEDGVAFTSAAHKAYLCISSAQSAKTIHFALPDDEEITSVGRVGEASPFDTRVYDLSGRRISQPARGIYLRNRKAYIVK